MKTILTLLRMVLEINNFEFNGQLYLQVGGTAMGARVAPTTLEPWGQREPLSTYPPGILPLAPFSPPLNPLSPWTTLLIGQVDHSNFIFKFSVFPLCFPSHAKDFSYDTFLGIVIVMLFYVF